MGQLDITPVVAAANHRGIRQLLLAHGAPLPPLPTESAEEAVAQLAAAAAAASVDAELPALPHCHEFTAHEEGVRFCEQQLLTVACRCNLCRPPSEAISLEQLLHSHAR